MLSRSTTDRSHIHARPSMCLDCRLPCSRKRHAENRRPCRKAHRSHHLLPRCQHGCSRADRLTERVAGGRQSNHRCAMLVDESRGHHPQVIMRSFARGSPHPTVHVWGSARRLLVDHVAQTIGVRLSLRTWSPRTASAWSSYKIIVGVTEHRAGLGPCYCRQTSLTP